MTPAEYYTAVAEAQARKGLPTGTKTCTIEYEDGSILILSGVTAVEGDDDIIAFKHKCTKRWHSYSTKFAKEIRVRSNGGKK